MAVDAEIAMDDVSAEKCGNDGAKKLSGRRKKAAKAKQVKPGSFGAANSDASAVLGTEIAFKLGLTLQQGIRMFLRSSAVDCSLLIICSRGVQRTWACQSRSSRRSSEKAFSYQLRFSVKLYR